MTEDRLLTVRELAERLSCSERQIQDMAAKSEIPAVKVGALWRFEPTAIERWLAAQRTGPEKSAQS